MARDSQFAKMRKKPKFKIRHSQPLPPVRAPARLPAQISDVPHLLPRTRAARGNSRRGEGQLVGAPKKTMQTDPISDLLTRIRNAAKARHARVDIPTSKLKVEVARILKEEGYISTYKLIEENKTRKTLRLFLKYTPDKRSVITDLKRISKPGSRRYLGSRESARRWRDGHQHHDDAQGRHDRPRRAQSAWAGKCCAKSGKRRAN